MSWSAPRRATATIVGAVVAATMCSIAVPSAGASPAATTTQTAIAGWQLSGPIAANVSLQATEVSGPIAPTLFFFVSEQFCDVARNQEVFRTFLGQQPVRQDYFVVFQHLAGAVLAVPAMQVTGTEQRLHNCSSPSGTPHTVSLGTSTVSLFAGWHATGPIFVRQPGTIARPAAALGLELSSGLLNLGDLGRSQSAELDQTTS